MKVENKIEIFNIPNRVICKICMGTYKKITNTHLEKHGLSPKLYLKKYPNAILTGALTLKKQSKKMKVWLKKHPEKTPPPTRLKEYRQDKDFMEKAQYHNALVQNLPYRKKQLSKQFKEQWNDLEYKKRRQKRVSKESKERWANLELRKKMIQKMLIPKKERIKENIPKIKKLRKKGYSYPKIAAILGFSHSTVYNWLNEQKPKGR